jgi:hypothetical protein
MINIGAPPSIGRDNKGNDHGRKCDSVRHKHHHDVRELSLRIQK